MKDHRPSGLTDLAWMSHGGAAAAERAVLSRRLQRPILIINLFVLFGMEAALLLGFIQGTIAAVPFISAHLGLCTVSVALCGAVLCLIRGRDQLGTVLLTATWTLVAGPFGPMMAAALLLPQRRCAINADLGVELDMTNPEEVHGALLDRRLRLAQAHRVVALSDVFIDGSQTERFNALRLISKSYDAAMAPPLKRAMADPDASVRVLAATVMAQQQNQSIKRIGALQSAAEAKPETARQWSQLGDAHFDYARSGLLERPRAEAELREALACLVRAAQLAPHDADVKALLETIRCFAISAQADPVTDSNRLVTRVN